MKNCWLIVSTEIDCEDTLTVCSPGIQIPFIVGDKILICEKSTAGEILAKRHGAVSEVSRLSGISRTPYLFRVKYDKTADLTTSVLSELQYSLKVDCYNRIQSKSGNKNFFRLSWMDFETIRMNKVFYARTAFGFIINSLPPGERYDFIRFLHRKTGVIDFKTIEYVESLNVLFEYIECDFSVVVNKNKIVNSRKCFKSVSNKSIAQYRENIFNTIEQNQTTEKEFQKLFRNTNWPILL